MFNFLKNHPFAIEAYFKNSLVLTFAVPKDDLQPLIPACLELDSFKDKYAFIAVAMVETSQLRPKGFPEFMGNDFFLIGYRIFVRYTNQAGKRLRGLFILKSETDKRKMELLGDIFTHYNYTTTDIKKTVKDGKTEIISVKSKFNILIDNNDGEILLPPGSPFSDWKEARKFAGPLPFTFSFNKNNNKVLIIEGVRENWNPEPVNIIHCSFDFLNKLNLKEAVLANAFMIRDIPYYWKKGKTEQWK